MHGNLIEGVFRKFALSLSVVSSYTLNLTPSFAQS